MSASWGTEAEDKPLSPPDQWAVLTFQWHTPEHAGDINPRAEEGLEKSCPCSGTHL